MALNIKAIRDKMRNDAGVNGDAQRIEQTIWILFLKVYDIYEKRWKLEAEFENKSYESIIPKDLAWDSWAKSYEIKDGKKVAIKSITGDELLDFVNIKLFPTLKNLKLDSQSPLNQRIVKKAFEDANNYMRDGVLLRDVINIIDELELKNKDDTKELSLIYETFLKELQSAGKSGEFYTPRAVTDFVMQVLEPKIGDKIADLACGTGGFLISAYHYLEQSKALSAEDREIINSCFYGCEKKALPYILCVTGFLINGIENPNLDHDNSFATPFNDLDELEKFDIIAMNPPYGGSEKKETIKFFPEKFKSSETADLFMAIITERLARKAAVVIPDGFLFGNDGAKINIKKRLLDEFNLYLIVRLPKSVFAPYTGITTNILFFEKSPMGTQSTAFYRLDMPDNLTSFSKTKSMQLEHFAPFWEWYKNGKETLSDENGNFKAKIFSKDELVDRKYNFDLCGFVSQEEEILNPQDLIAQVKVQREALNNTLDSIMEKISVIIKDNQ